MSFTGSHITKLSSLRFLFPCRVTAAWGWFSSGEGIPGDGKKLQKEETAPQTEQSGQRFRRSTVSRGQRFRLLHHRRVLCLICTLQRIPAQPQLVVLTSVSVCRLGKSNDALKSIRNKPTSGVMYCITYVFCVPPTVFSFEEAAVKGFSQDF